jgi:hypothetical protein
MGHYAYLDENNIVTQVIVGKNEGEDGIDWQEYYGAKRTSYNTIGGIHLEGGTPFRKNYAGIGFFYDETKDAFIPPKPFESWTLNEETCLWEAPIAKPEDGLIYIWNEDTQNWEEFITSV